MRLIKMAGGLGNQMFIYAMYLKMKKSFPDTKLDLSDIVHYKVHYGYEMNKVFNLPRTEFRINRNLKKVIEFLFFKTILERKQNGSMQPYSGKHTWPFIYYKGFYQSEKYFEGIEDEVRKAFTFDTSKANRQSLEMIDTIARDNNSVSIHIRRGDYLQEPHWSSVGYICQQPYYLNAIALLKEKGITPHFYVFSEDLQWAKDNLPLENAVYVDWNKGEDSWQDMMLMSKCKHNILCNSTFSWWGGYLNPNPDKIVIAPTQWSKYIPGDAICPASWLKADIK